MSLREWIRSRIRDDQKHAEITAREERTERIVADLRRQREANNFGQLFQTATHPTTPYPRRGRP